MQTFKKSIFNFAAFMMGHQKAKEIKQRFWLWRRGLNAPVVSSNEERHIFTALKDKLKIVFDVGIQNELSYYHIKKDCSYHLFEPNHKFVSSLKKQIATFANADIKLNEFGLSDENKDDCIYYEQSQSFQINPAHQKDEVDTGKRFSVRKLDDYVTENQIHHIDYLKIDTEGFDYKIILGGMQTIKAGKVSYIQFEFWDNIKKFVDLLKNDFDLYMIIEPRLLKVILEKITPQMTLAERQVNFRKSLVALDDLTINLLDNKISPTGAGCNVFGISKKVRQETDLNKITIDVNPQK